MSAAIAQHQAPALVHVGARLPMPAGLVNKGIDAVRWKVLTEVIFPTARTPEAIELAVDYCRARSLDIMKRPVHIVQVWSSAVGGMVENIWPGITEIQTTAHRTQQFAGMDAPEWGPTIRRVFKGNRKIKEGGREKWEPYAVELHFPEWCAVKVWRLVNGTPRAFTEPVFWLESYATVGGRNSELPNDMWSRRPRGQLLKCAKAASLRAGFPEESDQTSEEMEGRTVEGGGIPIPDQAELTAPADDQETEPPPPPPPKKPPGTFQLDGYPEPFPKTGAGVMAALERLQRDVRQEQGPVLVMKNFRFMDWAAEKWPDLADQVAEIRAAAAEQLTPAGEPEVGETTAEEWPGQAAGAEAPEPAEEEVDQEWIDPDTGEVSETPTAAAAPRARKGRKSDEPPPESPESPDSEYRDAFGLPPYRGEQ